MTTEESTKKPFDRLAEYDRVKRNGHSHDCAIGIVTQAQTCTCGCVPRWVIDGKTHRRWKYQTTTRRTRKK